MKSVVFLFSSLIILFLTVNVTNLDLANLDLANLDLANFDKAKQFDSSFMPANDLWKEDDLMKKSNISKEMFQQIIEIGYDLYMPQADANGELLVINDNWSDPTVNANCSRIGGQVTINMYGGLARRDEVTPDGFALVLCHELGHAYGGTPYIWSMSQMSAEGQADYYGAKNCLKEVFNKLNASEMLAQPTSIMEERCTDSNSLPEESKKCLRGLSAGKSIATLLATIKELTLPTYFTPDDLVVDVTELSYPETVQCRLDTYLAANIDLERPCCWFKETDEESCSEINKLGPFVKTVAWQFDGDSGSAGENIQPGEEVKLSVLLKNIGRKSAENVQVKINSNSDKVQLKNNLFSFVNLDSNEEVTLDNIKLAVSPEMDCGNEFDLNLEVSYGEHRREITRTYRIGQQHFNTVSFDEEQGVEIPDNDSNGVTTELFVPFGVANKKVTVPINISHNYIGDLKVTLTDPDGNQVILVDRKGYNNDDLIGTFGKDLETQGELQSFKANAPGTWVLNIIDNANLDTGTLNTWGIEVEHYTCE